MADSKDDLPPNRPRPAMPPFRAPGTPPGITPRPQPTFGRETLPPFAPNRAPRPATGPASPPARPATPPRAFAPVAPPPLPPVPAAPPVLEAEAPPAPPVEQPPMRMSSPTPVMPMLTVTPPSWPAIEPPALPPPAEPAIAASLDDEGAGRTSLSRAYAEPAMPLPDDDPYVMESQGIEVDSPWGASALEASPTPTHEDFPSWGDVAPHESDEPPPHEAQAPAYEAPYAAPETHFEEAAATPSAGENIAAALESVAARIRRGELRTLQADPTHGDAGALAAALAALLGVRD